MSGYAKSGNKGADRIIQWGRSYWVETCFERAEKLKPCPIGATGACCKICHMGPCRFILSSSEEKVDKGVCGARLDTVVARNFLRMAVSGAAAHSGQARNLAFVLLGVANGEIIDFEIADVKKLNETAENLEIEYKGRAALDVARDVAESLINEFGRQQGYLKYIRRAPRKTQKRWMEWGIVPVGIDREITESIYSTHMGVDHDPDNILLTALRVSLADGWGSSMIAADISDILFGDSRTRLTDAGLGIFKDDEVNIVVVGHDPTLANKLRDISSEQKMIEYAVSNGAKGINIGSLFIAGQDLSMAGGFTNQELCIMTGIVEAVIIDEQCIMPSLVDVANSFHTKIISTSGKARFPGTMFVPYNVQKAGEVAREILKIAIDNYPNRTGLGERITDKYSTTGVFPEYYFKEHERLIILNQAIKEGIIRGIAGLVGCDNPRVQATGIHKYLAEELIGEDVLVITTECGSAACAGSGYLDEKNVIDKAGPGLRRVFHEMGVSPILHMGDCTDNSRLLNLFSLLVKEGSISDEIGGIPAVIIAPEWMAEKEVSVGCYFAASGLPVILGGTSPVQAHKEVQKIMTELWVERFKGSLLFESEYGKMFDLVIKYIDKLRKDTNLRDYKCVEKSV